MTTTRHEFDKNQEMLNMLARALRRGRRYDLEFVLDVTPDEFPISELLAMVDIEINKIRESLK